MNTNRTRAQKLDSVGTFYVMLAVVLAVIAVGTYFTLTEIIPAVQNFMDTLSSTSVQPHKTR